MGNRDPGEPFPSEVAAKFFLMDLLGSGCLGCGAAGPILCAGCRTRLPSAADGDVPGVDRVVAAFDYRGVVRDLVLGLKLRHQRPCATPLVAGLVAEVMRRGLLGSAITWVPGRRRDIWDRGFDHAHVIAAGVGRGLGLPLLRCLERAGRAADQAGLGREERLANIEGAFSATSTPREIVLVDDLLTTGATARVCAAALSRAGARRVELLAAARA